MATVLLDALGDVDLTTGRMVVTTDPAIEYRQKMNARLSSFKGEWRYDTGRGVPYFERIFIKNPRLSDVQAVFFKTIMSVPGTTGVSFTSFSFNKTTRRLTIAFSTSTDFQSAPVNFNQTFGLFRDAT